MTTVDELTALSSLLEEKNNIIQRAVAKLRPQCVLYDDATFAVSECFADPTRDPVTIKAPRPNRDGVWPWVEMLCADLNGKTSYMRIGIGRIAAVVEGKYPAEKLPKEIAFQRCAIYIFDDFAALLYLLTGTGQLHQFKASNTPGYMAAAQFPSLIAPFTLTPYGPRANKVDVAMRPFLADWCAMSAAAQVITQDVIPRTEKIIAEVRTQTQQLQPPLIAPVPQSAVNVPD